MAMGNMNVALLMKEIELYECIIPFLPSLEMSLEGGIDVNRAPLLYPEDDNAASSPNSTVSSISAGKRAERELMGDHEHEGERTSCSQGSDEGDGGGTGGADGDGRKKLRLSREQSMVLEETFKEHSTLNPKQKLALAEQLNLRPRQVEVWFQNRRARTKLKQTEVDCEYLKRCCENLTRENRRLQKEVQELRALKLSPQLYKNMSPPTTLTMCPSCERVAALSCSSSPATSAPIGPFSRQKSGQQSVPINPWAALQMHQEPANPPP
ncbi:hypothetical protein CDL15_Pgr027173 [Punica granatum]|uniref:Homeobox domain-containing protein n=1 Tax=Punica granatum TaxID=22663 RepID=A0A218X9S3_PUNGR|nr:hypothetical protein CDL15_Pgr027173 [Punica granatum]PKI45078.1 hypothetical protein CRG98_034540 [Punica granatum]